MVDMKEVYWLVGSFGWLAITAVCLRLLWLSYK